jgi:hypothetical protein
MAAESVRNRLDEVDECEELEKNAPRRVISNEEEKRKAAKIVASYHHTYYELLLIARANLALCCDGSWTDRKGTFYKKFHNGWRKYCKGQWRLHRATLKGLLESKAKPILCKGGM